jgi:hypothetical protein
MPTLQETVNANLQLLYRAPGGKLHRSQFLQCDLGTESTFHSVVAFMEHEDLIETEDDPNEYYLTEYGFLCAENGLVLAEEPAVDETDVTEATPTTSTKKRSYDFTMVGAIAVIGVFSLIVRMNSNDDTKAPGVPEKTLEELKHDVVKKSDSIQASRNRNDQNIQ